MTGCVFCFNGAKRYDQPTAAIVCIGSHSMTTRGEIRGRQVGVRSGFSKICMHLFSPKSHSGFGVPSPSSAPVLCQKGKDVWLGLSMSNAGLAVGRVADAIKPVMVRVVAGVKSPMLPFFHDSSPHALRTHWWPRRASPLVAPVLRRRAPAP